MSLDAHVLHGIFKQHQVHDCIHFIVGVQSLIQSLTERLPGTHWQVLGISYAFGKVAINKWLAVQLLLL